MNTESDGEKLFSAMKLSRTSSEFDWILLAPSSIVLGSIVTIEKLSLEN